MMTISVFSSRLNIFCHCAQMLLNLSSVWFTFAWPYFDSSFPAWLWLRCLWSLTKCNRWCLFRRYYCNILIILSTCRFTWPSHLRCRMHADSGDRFMLALRRRCTLGTVSHLLCYLLAVGWSS